MEEVKKITNDNKNIFDNYIKQQNNESHINILSTQAAEKFNGNISPAQLIENIVDGYISAGSYFGNIGLLACVFSYKKNRPFSTDEINIDFSKYFYAYIIASTALGIVSTRFEDGKFVVSGVLPILEGKLIKNIENFISNSLPEAVEYNKKIYEHIKTIFGEVSENNKS